MLARVGAVALTLIALAVLPVYGARSVPSATILCYHVVESPRDTPFSVDRQAFLQQIQYLASAGYNVIPLSELVDYLAGRRDSIPENAVVITVDDGWRCTYTEMFPVLKKFRFPFTVFIYPKIINQTAYALTWKQIREMADEDVDIESHTFSHAYLTHGRHGMGLSPEYMKWLRFELDHSKELLETKTGKPVRFLAYPYGDYDSTVAAVTAEEGYEAAFTSNFGPVFKGSNPLRLKRVMVMRNTGFDEFRRHLGTGRLLLADQTPLPGAAFDQPVISARIQNLDSVDPSSVGMAVLSLGRNRSFFDQGEGRVSLVAKDGLKGRFQRAVVWGTDKRTGRRLEAAWTFVLPDSLEHLDVSRQPADDDDTGPDSARRGSPAKGR